LVLGRRDLDVGPQRFVETNYLEPRLSELRPIVGKDPTRSSFETTFAFKWEGDGAVREARVDCVYDCKQFDEPDGHHFIMEHKVIEY